MIYIYLPKVPVEPVGGIQTLFDYAERLNELAGQVVAKIVCHERHVRQVLPRSYSLVPVVYQEPVLKPTDIILLPEVLIHRLSEFPVENRKYLVVLNWRLLEIFTQRLKTPLPALAGILTNSRYTLKKLHAQFPATPITAIPHVIDSRFRSTVPFRKRKKLSILILNRRNTQHIGSILNFLQHVPHQVTIVNNVSAAQLIALYNQHQIFINLGYPEGFCRPAAEAMASGCVVVGFTGGGGNDFMHHGYNSFIAPDGNEQELIKQLNHLFHTLTAEQLHDVSLAARETITAQYTPLAQAKALYSCFKKELPRRFTGQKIAQLYARAKRTRSAVPQKTPVYAPSQVEVLQSQLFHERELHKAITSSKFFTYWQKYCMLRDTLKEKIERFVDKSSRISSNVY